MDEGTKSPKRNLQNTSFPRRAQSAFSFCIGFGEPEALKDPLAGSVRLERELCPGLEGEIPREDIRRLSL